MTDYPNEKGGFKVLLYGLFHIKDIKTHPCFDQASAEKAVRNYGKDKLKIIIEGLCWAVENRDVDYQSVFPGMKYSNEQILWYFDKTLREMQQLGLVDELLDS